MSETVAFFGLGAMGYPMAKHLVQRGGYRVAAYNRSRSKAEDLQQELGAESVLVANDPAHAIEQASRFIVTMMFDYESLRDTILNNDAAMAALKNKIFINCMTIGIDESLESARFIEDVGAQYIEAPVLGTNTVAIAGRLQILEGCTAQQSADADIRKLIECFGSINYIGDRPKGIEMKLCMNSLVAGLTVSFSQSVALVQRSNLPVEQFMNIVRNSAFHFAYEDLKLPRLLNRNYSDYNFTTTGLHKDLVLIRQMAENIGVNPIVLDALKELAEQTIRNSPDTAGHSDMVQVYETLNPPKPSGGEQKKPQDQ